MRYTITMVFVFLFAWGLQLQAQESASRLDRLLALPANLNTALMYIPIEKCTRFRLKSVPLPEAKNPSICLENKWAQNAGSGNKSSDHFTLLPGGVKYP